MPRLSKRYAESEARMSDTVSLRPLSASQREALEEATASYERAVTAPVARLLVARGIDRETAVACRLGVVADPHPGHERFRGFIAIPYLDREGKPLSMRFRCPEQHEHREFFHGKYMSLPDEPPRVYNIGAIHRADDTIHITEGEFDAMVLTRLGLHAIAMPGAQSWSPHHRRMLAGFSRVWVWPDGDDAGADFGRKVTQSLRTAKAVRMPRGMDVTELFVASGADAVLSLIDKEK